MPPSGVASLSTPIRVLLDAIARAATSIVPSMTIPERNAGCKPKKAAPPSLPVAPPRYGTHRACDRPLLPSSPSYDRDVFGPRRFKVTV
jgi:hypothetical protein